MYVRLDYRATRFLYAYLKKLRYIIQTRPLALAKGSKRLYQNFIDRTENTNKSDFDSIPVHAHRDGTDDIHGMAKGLPLTRDVSPPHAQVGVAPIVGGSLLTGASLANYDL